jgi:hypothetical protein
MAVRLSHNIFIAVFCTVVAYLWYINKRKLQQQAKIAVKSQSATECIQNVEH